MVLPIVVYGDPVLRKVGVDIDKKHEGLEQLIADMFETMYSANGVGLAAPQVGKAIRLFVIDATPFAERDEDDEEESAECTAAGGKCQVGCNNGTPKSGMCPGGNDVKCCVPRIVRSGFSPMQQQQNEPRQHHGHHGHHGAKVEVDVVVA